MQENKYNGNVFGVSLLTIRGLGIVSGYRLILIRVSIIFCK